MSGKTVFKGAVAVIFAALFLAMAGCGPDPFYVRVVFIEDVPDAGIVGTPLALTASIRPAFASNKDIIWSVKDAGNTGASISGNILHAAAGGIITIKAIIVNGIAEGKDYIQDFKIEFTVPKVITDIEIKTQPAKLVYAEGETLDLSGLAVTLTYDDDTTEDVGLAGFKARGITTSPAQGTALTVLEHNEKPVVVSAGGHTASTNNLAVSIVLVSGVTLDKTALTMLTISGTVTLKATVTPSNATNKAVTWSTSNPAVATVSNGVVTSIAAGSAAITVTTADGGFTAACTVTVIEAEARIGSTGYATLAAAISAAANDTLNNTTEIIILKDITTSEGYTIPDGKHIKLNVENDEYFTITANAGNFALFTVNAGTTLTMGYGNGLLALEGNNQAASANRRGVYVNGGTFNMNDSVFMEGFNNDNGDVFVSSTGRLSLSRYAYIETLTLSADLNGNAVIEVASGWSGRTISKLNLYGGGNTIESVISLWKNKTVLKGDGLNASSVDYMNYNLWKFIDASGHTQRINTQQPPDVPYGYAIGDSGQDIGKLIVATFNLYLEARRYSEATADMEIIVPYDYVMSKLLTIPNPGKAGITLTIKGKTATCKLTRGTQDTNSNNGLFIVPNGVRLVFENIVIDGNKSTHINNTASLVRINSGGIFTMNTGAVLQNNRATDGGGVYSNGGTFTMNGGEISGNTASSYFGGGGVYVTSSGTFTMDNGSKITNNTATNGGGVYLSSGTITMKGGEISGNTTEGSGGGVYATYGTFTMNNGSKITNNTAIQGGGVAVTYSSTFTMNGGEISGNTASSTEGKGSAIGGGVYIFYGIFTMNGGDISNNEAICFTSDFGVYGGGVYFSHGGTFTMNGGYISGNRATNYYWALGGGVYFYSDGTFTMNGGTIYGTNEPNTSLQNNAPGGGESVYVVPSATGTAKYGDGTAISSTSNTITGHN